MNGARLERRSLTDLKHNEYDQLWHRCFGESDHISNTQ